MSISERDHLNEWQLSKQIDIFDEHDLLKSWLLRHYGEERFEEFSQFGQTAMSVIDPAAMEDDRWWNHPRVERHDGMGNRRENVVHSPYYHLAGEPCWQAGVMSALATPGEVWAQSVLFFLSAHCGEMGHLCPITCTSGLVRALQQKGSDILKRKWLPGLTESQYDKALIGAQFLTEVQGGSDVGANVVEARPDEEREGLYRLSGEKWFCSVANADLFAVTARPVGAAEGTKGLGCFLVPRLLDDGSPNHFVLRRLKEKIGTRTLATAEIDFEGALAWPIGRIDEGLKIAVGIVLNTSRFMNALGAVGSMRRAYIEGKTYAEHRAAFGHAIGNYPLVRETLARMKAEESAALVSTFYLALVIDRMDTGKASAEDLAVYRLLVNANKYWTAVASSRVVRDGIEILGGNGTIETFSILPRLYRDTIVLESWEGSHNVLCMQVLRDAQKLGLFDAMERRMDEWHTSIVAPFKDDLLAARRATKAKLDRCLKDETYALLHIKRHIESLMQGLQVTLLAEHAAAQSEPARADAFTAAAELLFDQYLRPGYRPEDDADYMNRINRVLAGDLG